MEQAVGIDVELRGDMLVLDGPDFTLIIKADTGMVERVGDVLVALVAGRER